MEILQTYGKEIVSLIVPLITWALNTFFKSKAKLQIAMPHTFTFLVQQPLYDKKGKVLLETQTISTRSFKLLNAGKESASKIELVFNWKPLCVNVSPPRHFTEITESDAKYVMIFDSLAPSEYFDCEVFSINSELPNLVTVRSDQCVAQYIEMTPQPVVASWQRRLAALLMLSGLALVIYLSILILQFLVLKTPIGH